MVIRVGSFATIRRKPRQARKGAAVADEAGVEGVLARIAALNQGRVGRTTSIPNIEEAESLRRA